MAPINLFPLLEIYCSPAKESCPHLMRATGSCRPIQELQEWELIQRDPNPTPPKGLDYEPHGWIVTEKGRVMVKALTELPMPINQWRVAYPETHDRSLFEKVFGKEWNF